MCPASFIGPRRLCNVESPGLNFYGSTREEANMLTSDVITRWEEALSRALSPDMPDPLSEKDLEVVAGLNVRSTVRAGGGGTSADDTCPGHPGCPWM